MDTATQTLIRNAIKGKRKSQNLLYQKYERRMYAVCWRYAKNQDEAMDMMQEGFIRIFRYLGQYRGDAPLEKWMDRVMANACLRQLSKNKPIDFKEENELERIIQPYDPITEKSDADAILALIKKLPTGYRTIFNLFAVEGYSHKEIAEQLGIKESTSRSQYLRAKRAIQLSMKQEM